MRAERVVCDTNVLISAAIAPLGKPFRVLQYLRSNCILLISNDGLAELSSRLQRPKFDRYLSAAARLMYLRMIVSVVEIIPIPGTLQVCRDADDNKILETAIVGGADCLVTGDGDLLALRPVGETGEARQLSDADFRSVLILRPAEFLALVDMQERPEG